MPPHTEEWDSKEFSWKWVTAAELLSHHACDLIYAKFTPDTDVGNVTLRNGHDNTGEVIMKLLTAGAYNCEFSPRRPVYCPRGLYVDTITTGDVFVQWRVRDSEEG